MNKKVFSKKMKSLLVFVFILGSWISNPVNVSAQTPIKPLDPNFQDGVEYYVGYAVPGGRDTIRLYNVGFVSGTPFEDATLDVDTAFFLSDVNITGPNKDTLFVTIGFALKQGVLYGQDFTDVLRIRAQSPVPEFRLPLRGRSVSFEATPSSLSFAEYLAPGESSEAKPVTIINLDLSESKLDYWFNTQSFKAEVVSHTGGIPPSFTLLDVQFIPPINVPVGTVFYDTLSITDRADTTLWVQKIPVSGRSLHVNVDPSPVDFGGVVAGTGKILDLNVEVREAAIEDIVTTDEHFSVDRRDLDPSAGGTLHVTFTPDVIQDYSGYLVIFDDAHEPYIVRLTGKGSLLPVLSADPDPVDFGHADINTTAYTEVTVTLTNPLSKLDYNSLSLSGADPGVFSVVGIRPGTPSTDEDVVVVTLSFSPTEINEYEATLIVHAEGAADLEIPVSGTGIPESSAPQLSPQQATAISGTVAAAPALSVKDGDIVVSRVPAGSSIQVYNLQGQPLKTQSAVSDVEILKTASFPRSIYIVVVNGDKKEILKQKVVL
jgi:hypothetical protein